MYTNFNNLLKFHILLNVHNYIRDENGKINTLWYECLWMLPRCIWNCLNAAPKIRANLLHCSYGCLSVHVNLHSQRYKCTLHEKLCINKLLAHKTSLTAGNANIQCSKVALSIFGVNFNLLLQEALPLERLNFDHTVYGPAKRNISHVKT